MNRLSTEVLIGARTEVAANVRERTNRELEMWVRCERIATAGGPFVGAEFPLLTELLDAEDALHGAKRPNDLVGK